MWVGYRNLSLILLTQHDTVTPRTPASNFSTDLALKILDGPVFLILVELDAFADAYLLLELDLKNATNTLNFLMKIGGAPPAIRSIGRLWSMGCCDFEHGLFLAGLVFNEACTKT